MLDLVYFLLIGLIAGWLAGKIMKGRNLDLLTSLGVGVLGGFLFRLVGLASIGLLGNLIAATAGSVVLLFLLQKFGKRL